ncbi:hypothetical protein QQM41_15040 (plasmid) [Acetobacter sp. AC2005]|uniref:hypothetical protein n=1 Tax=Acetobacter sp. AC2005 TaxID=3134142 RepID=UPI0030CBBD4F
MTGSDRPLHSYAADHLITFDAIEAARDPEVQTALLEMAREDGSEVGIMHALNVITEAKRRCSTTEKTGRS